MLENLDLAFSFRPFAPEDADLRVLELLTRAVAERRGLRFDYRKPGEKRGGGAAGASVPCVDYEGRLYLLAHDLARGEVRTFVPGADEEPAVTERAVCEAEGFRSEEGVRARAFGVMTGKGDYQVVIEMDAWLTDILRGPAAASEPGGGGVAGRRVAGAAAAELPGGDRAVGAELGGACHRGGAAGAAGAGGQGGEGVGGEVRGRWHGKSEIRNPKSEASREEAQETQKPERNMASAFQLLRSFRWHWRLLQLPPEAQREVPQERRKGTHGVLVLVGRITEPGGE